MKVEKKGGKGEKGYRMPGTRGKVRAQLYRGLRRVGVSMGSLSPGSVAVPVVRPPGDGAAALPRTAGSSTMRLSRG